MDSETVELNALGCTQHIVVEKDKNDIHMAYMKKLSKGLLSHTSIEESTLDSKEIKFEWFGDYNENRQRIFYIIL